MDRPSHPDMTTLIDLILQLDGQASEGRRDVGDIAGEIIDPESLSYLAVQRVMRAQMLTHRPMDMRTQVTASALYLEGFVMGARYAARKA